MKHLILPLLLLTACFFPSPAPIAKYSVRCQVPYVTDWITHSKREAEMIKAHYEELGYTECKIVNRRRRRFGR